VASRSDRSGLLVVKIRLVESNPLETAPRFVATITTTLDLAAREEARVTASSVEEVLAIVRRWIDAFRRGSAGDKALTKP
jgi:hypothetical protein